MHRAKTSTLCLVKIRHFLAPCLCACGGSYLSEQLRNLWRKDIRRQTNRMWRTGAMCQPNTRPDGSWPADAWERIPISANLLC